MFFGDLYAVFPPLRLYLAQVDVRDRESRAVLGVFGIALFTARLLAGRAGRRLGPSPRDAPWQRRASRRIRHRGGRQQQPQLRWPPRARHLEPDLRNSLDVLTCRARSRTFRVCTTPVRAFGDKIVEAPIRQNGDRSTGFTDAL